jgi:hypothetical protein
MRTSIGRWLVSCTLILGVSSSAYAQLPGAIFTTLSDGSRVNDNIYSQKCGAQGVWLDGGPGPNAPQGAAGLPDGDYYFQVTDPSGKTLLSTDAVKYRQIRVTSGIISGLSGAGNHNTGSDIDHGAVTIELCPFLDTPNPGGVYKVWVTPVDQFVGDPTLIDNTCRKCGFHGFIPSSSKTDNFKVGTGAGGACLVVWKDFDNDGSGTVNYTSTPDSSGPWPVTIVDPLGTSNTFFTPFGAQKETCTFAQLPPGVYSFTEGTASNYVLSFNRYDNKYLTGGTYPDTTVQIRIKTGDTGYHELVFGNRPK